MINFALNGTNKGGGSVTNNGSLIANGGEVMVTAQAAQGVLDNVINMNGVAQAQSVGMRTVKLLLSGDPNGGVVRRSWKIKRIG